VAAHLTERGRRAGRLAARVSLRAGRWPERLIVVPLFVDGQQPVIVAARDLPAGVPLSPADARLEHRRAASVRSDAVDSVDALEGKQPRATIVAGQTIRTRQLAAVPLVKRGSRVTVSVVLPGLRLRSSGEVREDGGQGETVMVLCTSTRKLLRARVVGPRDVQIDL
jgi:flagella basal body P-ring formation protein FlgA